MRYCLHGDDGCLRVYCVTVPCQAALEDLGTEFLVAGFGLALVAVLQARSLRAGAAAITAALALIPTASWLAWVVRWHTAGPPQLCFRIYPTLPIPRLALALSLWAVPCAISGCRRSVLVGACCVALMGAAFPVQLQARLSWADPRVLRDLYLAHGSAEWRGVEHVAARLLHPSRNASARLVVQRGVCTSRGWTKAAHGVRGPACARESGPSQHRRRRATPPGARHLEVGGCARSIGKRGVDALEGKVTALAELGAFASVAAHVFEDGSSDETLPALRAWAARGGSAVPLKITTALEPLGGERTDRLALCRNVLFASAQERLGLVAGMPARRSTLRPADLIFVALDLDPGDCPYPLDSRAIAAAADLIGTAGGWAVLTANAAGRDRRREHEYYDKWALRSASLAYVSDCNTDYAAREASGCASCDRCFGTHIRIDAAAPIFAVESAFNGLALYSMRALAAHGAAACGYSGRDPRGSPTCEHVPFHTCLHQGGLRIGIAPFLPSVCGPRWATRHKGQRLWPWSRSLPNGTRLPEGVEMAIPPCGSC